MRDSRRIALRGLKIDPLTQREALDRMFDELAARRGGMVLTPNLDHLRRHTREPAVRGAYERAELVLPDGAPLVWASRIQGTPLPERVAGSDLIWSVADRAAQAGCSVFLLGGAPAVAPAAAACLRERFPKLRIAGHHCPPFGFIEDEGELGRMEREVLPEQPDIVFVGLPSPLAERTIERLRPSLRQTWFLGLGVSLSFVSGDVQRAPLWTQRSGLEWLWRLSQEPGRLARRYLVEGLPFAFGLFASALAVRWGLASAWPGVKTRSSV
jgi:N-acetylglucosaminyldiphosphoundecaprenol N-acetyl-beta-D-mannosaminyltransferase